MKMILVILIVLLSSVAYSSHPVENRPYVGRVQIPSVNSAFRPFISRQSAAPFGVSVQFVAPAMASEMMSSWTPEGSRNTPQLQANPRAAVYGQVEAAPLPPHPHVSNSSNAFLGAAGSSTPVPGQLRFAMPPAAPMQPRYATPTSGPDRKRKWGF